MAQESVDIDHLFITPLAKGMAKGVFSNTDAEFENLVSWFKTGALQAQREKKSKTYVAIYHDVVVGYVTISAHYIEVIPGIISRTSHNFQILQVGKLYVDPSVRGVGIGKRLMDFVLDIAQTMDDMVGCIGLLVDANNNEATIRFYTTFGFDVIDDDTKGRTRQMFFRIPEYPLLPKR